MGRKDYAAMYGPTTGDRVRLGDTDLIVEVGFELGNRHLSFKILPDKILVPYEALTFCYPGQPGFTVREEYGSFSDFIRVL